MKIFRSKRGRQNRPPRRRRETSAATCSCMPPSRHCPLRARRLRSRPSLERIRDRLPQWVWANHPPQRRRTMTTRREKVDPCIRSRPFRAGHLPPHLRAVASRLPKMRIKKIPTSASAFPCTLMRALCRHHRRHHVPPLSRVVTITGLLAAGTSCLRAATGFMAMACIPPISSRRPGMRSTQMSSLVRRANTVPPLPRDRTGP